MKRFELEKYLGYFVKVILFDGTILRGYLQKTGDEKFKRNPNLYIKRNCYCVTKTEMSNDTNMIFRCSHVKNVKGVKNE